MTTDLQKILEGCKKGNREAQRQFYDLFKGKMFALCLRFANNREDAEDLLQDGFINVFRDLHQYRGHGSLEGWVRKVFTNTALQHLRRQKKNIPTTELEGNYFDFMDNTPAFEEGEPPAKGLIKLLQKMPPGFRTVLNLYVLENYSHQQIAEELGISVGTSKSQFNRAKAWLKNAIEKHLVL